MSNEATIKAKRLPDGTLVQILPDGKTRPMQGRTDWERLGKMTDADIEAAALSDPDAQPLTPDRLARMKPVPRVKTIRRALALTQEEFSARYHIPLGTLRDWEQGRTEPDEPAHAYLTVIARDPNAVRKALASAPKPP